MGSLRGNLKNLAIISRALSVEEIANISGEWKEILSISSSTSSSMGLRKKKINDKTDPSLMSKFFSLSLLELEVAG